MASSPLRVYWDSCVWIDLIQATPGRGENCEDVVRQARDGSLQIWTSALAIAECYKLMTDAGDEQLAGKEAAFERFISQPFIRIVTLDFDVALEARRLLRAHPPLKKPNDGVHLASAALWNCDVLHTYDRRNLIRLDGQVARKDGAWLRIEEPPAPIQAGLALPLWESPGTSGAALGEAMLPLAAKPNE